MYEPIDLDASVERTRTALAAAVALFSEAWVSGSPPDLSAYLPGDPVQRRTILIELIKIDLEYRWLRYHFPKRLIEYRAEFAELQDGPLPAELVYEEFHARRRGSHAVDAATTLAEVDAMSADSELVRVTSDRAYRSTMLTRPSAQIALHAIDVGDHVDDFDLLMRIGAGAFAQVYLARQRSMQRLVAVKISHNYGTESETLAQLDHEYIVRIFDQRLIADGELKLLYMQYQPGGTLLDVLRLLRSTPSKHRGGQLLLDAVDEVLADKGEIRPTESAVRMQIAALTWPESIAWLGRRLAEALQHASERGVLHRDIKPANVLLSAEGIPKLADFNVSFGERVSASPLAFFGGSLAYMSPEQLEACHPDLPGTAADLDTRSDIFALTVMLWELLTGRRPFADEASAGESEKPLAHMLELRRKPVEPQFLAELPADCPTALRRMLLKCLSPDREDRYSCGSELAQQLDLCLDDRARDLVYPPPNSWRARLSRRPTLILSSSAMVGVGLASVYLSVHLQELIATPRLPDATTSQLYKSTIIYDLCAVPLAVLVYFYISRDLLAVPRGLRDGRRYDEATLARMRSRTLFWGDLVAMNTLLFAVLSTAAGVMLLRWFTDLPARLLVHAATTVLVTGIISVAYTFFLSTFYIVRCVYPIYLRHSHTTADDSAELRAQRRRTTAYLAVTASAPLVGVLAGFTALEPAELPLVRDSVLGLCVGSGLAFVTVYWLYRKLDADLRALERVV